MKTVKDFSNKLLKRKEIEMLVQSDSNPGFDNALKFVSEHFKVDSSKVIIKGVNGKFGRREFTISAFIYDSADDKENIEPKKKVKIAAGGSK